jgi:hypothetical protein
VNSKTRQCLRGRARRALGALRARPRACRRPHHASCARRQGPLVWGRLAAAFRRPKATVSGCHLRLRAATSALGRGAGAETGKPKRFPRTGRLDAPAAASGARCKSKDARPRSRAASGRAGQRQGRARRSRRWARSPAKARKRARPAPPCAALPASAWQHAPPRPGRGRCVPVEFRRGSASPGTVPARGRPPSMPSCRLGMGRRPVLDRGLVGGWPSREHGMACRVRALMHGWGGRHPGVACGRAGWAAGAGEAGASGGRGVA